jgi:hypothetical protein
MSNWFREFKSLEMSLRRSFASPQTRSSSL